MQIDPERLTPAVYTFYSFTTESWISVVQQQTAKLIEQKAIFGVVVVPIESSLSSEYENNG